MFMFNESLQLWQQLSQKFWINNSNFKQVFFFYFLQSGELGGGGADDKKKKKKNEVNTGPSVWTTLVMSNKNWPFPVYFQTSV